MSKFFEYIGSQLGEPKGVVGTTCCFMMNRTNQALYNGTIKEIISHPHKAVLDIGFGNGYLIQKVYNKTKATIYGIDISKDMLCVASARNKKGIQEGKVKLSLGSCCDLPFESQFFDAVSSVNTIYFWEDTRKGLEEIYRVLKDGGVFINTVYSKEMLEKMKYTQKCFRLFEMEDYVQLGKSAGFREVVKVDLSKKSFIVKFVK